MAPLAYVWFIWRMVMGAWDGREPRLDSISLSGLDLWVNPSQ